MSAVAPPVAPPSPFGQPMIEVTDRHTDENRLFPLFEAFLTVYLQPEQVEACLLNLNFPAASKRCNPR